jgi:hypothetical protein
MLEPKELVIAPGQTIEATLKINRGDFEGAVQFDIENLPHGVIVDNIGLNGILIPAGKSERQIFLSASNWVDELDRTFFAETKTARGGKKLEAATSRPVTLKVRKPSTLAQGAATESGPAR